MDKDAKKKLLRQWREEQRRTVRESFPVPSEVLQELFGFLDEELPEQGCDHTRRITEAWLEEHGHDVPTVCAWLDSHGGYCDCEVLANVEEVVEEALS